MLHTAPLWPENVPIQSPVVALRIMGSLSWHAERRYVDGVLVLDGCVDGCGVSNEESSSGEVRN